MQKAVTRRLTDTRPDINRATARRTYVIFWILQKKRYNSSINVRHKDQDITKGIHVGAQQLWESIIENTEPTVTKLLSGEQELQQLLNFESYQSTFREVSEQYDFGVAHGLYLWGQDLVRWHFVQDSSFVGATSRL